MRQLGPPPQLKGTATSSPAQAVAMPNPLRQAEAGKRRVSFFLSVGTQRKKALAQGAVASRHDQLCGVERGRTAFSYSYRRGAC